MNKDMKLIVTGIVISMIFVIMGITVFSYAMETLDKVAEEFGVSQSEIWNPPFPEYAIPGLEENLVINISIGSAFTLIIFGLALIIGRALKAGT